MKHTFKVFWLLFQFECNALNCINVNTLFWIQPSILFTLNFKIDSMQSENTISISNINMNVMNDIVVYVNLYHH